MIENPLPGGWAVPARYHDQEIPAFRGNPFIEALPPILSRKKALRQMTCYPEYDPSHRELEPHIREHLAAGLTSIRHPVALHLDLESRISRLIRWGYVGRNPMLPSFQIEIDARESSLRVEGGRKDRVISGGRGVNASATGLTFLGITGIGKTAAIEMCLNLYPQLILHSEYKGRPFTQTQVTWLRLQCPYDGSILSLCQNFFTAMDALHAGLPVPTNYRNVYVPQRPSIQRLIPSMARLAAQHGLGMLVLDEVQDLNPQGSRAILSFLVQLVNTIGIPVVLVGGIDALPVLTAQFRQARRGASEGDLILGRAQPGERFRKFCEVLWRFQYTRHEVPLTDKILEVLYDESQGITHYLVLLYKLAQIRAISTRAERITPALIRSVAKDCLAQAQPVLRLMRRGETEQLRLKGDTEIPKGIESVPFVRGDAVSEADARRKPLKPKLSAKGSKESAAPVQGEAPKPKPASNGPSRRRGRVPRKDEDRTLPALLRAAQNAGGDFEAELRENGVMLTPLWAQVAPEAIQV
jgi:hypothetical protein